MNKLLLGVMASSAIVYAHNYDIVLLESIPFGQLRLISEKRQRSVYADKTQSLFYKIWDTDYGRAKLFVNALNAGFFEKLAPLVGIINDEKNRCRGYVTTGGTLLLSNITQTKIKATNKQYILPIKEQTDKNYIKFYKTLLENTKRSKYVFIDFSPTNIIEINKHYYLIDLESVEPLSNLHRNFENHPQYSFHILGYPEFVRTLIKR